MPLACPNCSSPLPDNAVLCVQCGFHLPSGTILATQFERAPADVPQTATPDLNPYAAPALDEPGKIRERGRPAVFDLTPQGAARAKSVVQDADLVYPVIAMAFCICGLAWLVMFPWYAMRLVQWYQLNSQFEELRYPNAFSPHSEITAKFPDAKVKLWVGTIVGGCVLALIVLVIAWPSRVYY